MSDHKTKEQLISELAKLRKQISSIESNEFEEKRRKNKLLENELLNNAIIKDSPIGISIRDKNGTLLLANKAWRDIWQVTNKDILEYSQLKKKLTLNEKDLYLGEHQEAIKQLYKTGGKYFIPEIKLLKERKNKAKWISQHFYAVNGKKGEINRVVILTENITKHKNIEMELQQHKENLEKIIVERTAKLQKEITERKKAEQVLASYQEHLEQVVRERTSDLEIAKENIEKSEKMYRTLTDNLNVGIYRNTAGSKGRFIEVNPAIIKMFGYKNREEFLAINVAELYENSKERSKYSNKLIKLGSVKDEEIKLRKKNSEIFIGSVSAVSIKDKNGKVLFYDGIIEDITDRKRGEEALRNSEEKYRAVFENTGTATIIIEENDLISHTNQEFEKLS
nr:PAS domain S-box protein [Candidatus Cloacimonadota bacterium]